MCDKGAVERPYNGQTRAKTKAYDPARGGRTGLGRGLCGGGKGIGARTQQWVGLCLRAFPGVKEASVLEDRVAIRHASNVIGDGASTTGAAVSTFGVQGVISMFGRHETYVLEKCRK